MQRISVFLSSEQLTKLRLVAQRTGLKVAEIIRRAIDQFLQSV